MEPKNTVATGKPQVASAPAKQDETSNKPLVETNDKPAETQDAPLVNLEMAMQVLATSKSRSSGGAKIRPNVGYTLVAEKMTTLAGTNVPEQEQVIVKILLGALTKSKPVISEPELNKLVLAAHAAGKLKTKQDAWHIFRYYRTDLVKRGVLKQVDIAA
jgi:hypothetical protein